MIEKQSGKHNTLRVLLYIVFGILFTIVTCILVIILGARFAFRFEAPAQGASNITSDIQTKVAATLYAEYLPKAATLTPGPPFVAITKQIGPIWGSDRGEMYAVEITLRDIEWLTSEGHSAPDEGNIFLITHVTFRNLGPDPLRSIGSSDFLILDANGVLQNHDFFSSDFFECELETVDLINGGFNEGCIKFEVPKDRNLELIYAPYQSNNLGEGRFLSFSINSQHNGEIY